MSSKDLFVGIVQNHNEVLEPMYRLIGKKQIPFDGLCILHFDSHSDLSVPQKLYTDTNGNLNKYDVFSAISIESWMVPAIYSGHIDNVIWVYPYWTEQNFDTYNVFKVGRSKFDNSLKVTSTNNYFLSEDSHDLEENLLDSKTLHLHSVCIPSKSDELKFQDFEKNIHNILKKNDDRYMLDIDLDFFSTTNPFKYMFTERQYELLKNIYRFYPPSSLNIEDIEICTNRRKKQLLFLKDYFTSIHSNSVGPTTDNIELSEQLSELVTSLKVENLHYDFEWLHEIGTGIDDTNLPDHVSSDQEINYLISFLQNILITLPRPLVVFISRSAEDDYCPSEQVEEIQEKVLNLLKLLYNNVCLNFIE